MHAQYKTPTTKQDQQQEHSSLDKTNKQTNNTPHSTKQTNNSKRTRPSSKELNKITNKRADTIKQAITTHTQERNQTKDLKLKPRLHKSEFGLV